MFHNNRFSPGFAGSTAKPPCTYIFRRLISPLNLPTRIVGILSLFDGAIIAPSTLTDPEPSRFSGTRSAPSHQQSFATNRAFFFTVSRANWPPKQHTRAVPLPCSVKEPPEIVLPLLKNELSFC